MKLKVIVMKAEAEEQTSRTSGKLYATQTVGVLMPGEDFAVPHKMFLERAENGQYIPKPVGQYQADAEVKNVKGDLILSVNYRSMKATLSDVSAPKPAQAKAA